MAKTTAKKKPAAKAKKKPVKRTSKKKATTVEKQDKYALMKQVLANPEKFPIFRKHLDTLSMLKESITSQVATHVHLKKVFNSQDANVVAYGDDKWQSLPDLIELVRLYTFTAKMNQLAIEGVVNEFL